jgi:glycosyltransferase involved in cell wall biosynthesis
MKVLSWHVHAAWSTSFVSSAHETLVPVTPDRGPAGRGRPTTYVWPGRARETTPALLAGSAFDVVVLQRMEEIELLRRWTGLVAGVDVPAVYVEHNAPGGAAATTRHPLADQSLIPIVHVTAFNALMWDTGRAPTRVIEHGIPDPGPRWTGTLPRAAVVVNEPMRRGRITGTDLLPRIASDVPVDMYGIGCDDLPTQQLGEQVVGRGDLAHEDLLDELALRRVYVHLCRWTSLGLSLVEAMHLGMPVVGLATTEAPEALAGSGAFLSNDPSRLAEAAVCLIRDPDLARDAGQRCRRHALERFGLPRFHAEWDQLLQEVTR